MSSPKLPAFAGRCHIQLLPGQAAQAADTAAHLATFRALSPEALCRAGQVPPAQQRASAETAFGWVLAGMAFVLGLDFLLGLACAYTLSSCAPTRTAAERRHRAEHAEPAHGRYEWHEADTAD